MKTWDMRQFASINLSAPDASNDLKHKLLGSRSYLVVNSNFAVDLSKANYTSIPIIYVLTYLYFGLY